MNKMIKYITAGVVAAIILSFHSCHYLEVNDYFNETLKYDSIFNTKYNVERYLWATASAFSDECNAFLDVAAFTSDEAFSLTADFAGMQYVLGNVTPTDTKGMGKWNSMYYVIRKANTILANIDRAADLKTLEKREILGYTYFMRAYAYYRILIQYGPVVIIGDEPLNTNEEVDYYDRSRETFDNSVDYICDELERSAAYLLSDVPYGNFGRPTKGAALGLIARLRLMQASPLWNGGEAARRTFNAWRRSVDQVHYVSQTPDERKWAVAAMACKRIMDMNKYKLHTVARMSDTPPLPATVSNLPFPDGAGDIDPFRSYSDMFTGEALAVRNPEFLWGQWSESATLLSMFCVPVINLGGWNSVSIPQKIIDSYLMADGRTINNPSPDYPYSPTGYKGGSNETFSGYTLLGTASNMYVNREMRFYASIGFSECHWPCNSTSDNSKRNQTVTYYVDGNAGRQATDGNPDNYPVTGYTLKKFIHPDDAWAGTSAQVIQKPFPAVRYAEILLAYAEALNNLTTTHTVQDADGVSHTFSRDVNEIKRYFDMVRYRAGLPGLTPTELSAAATVQALIERERMVEFLFENKRYHDVRRWGKYEQTESEPIMGMDTEKSKAGGYYSIVPVNHSKARNRVVDRKLILFPIELTEIRKAASLDQNPGYQN
jgi:hypothetical protein